MELPELPGCGKLGIVEEEEEEEELTLTPNHTPSRSFDFIVWEKAYLDSIPAAGIVSSCSTTTTTSNSIHSTTPAAAAARQDIASNSSRIESLKPCNGPPTLIKGDAAEASIRDDDFAERTRVLPLMPQTSRSSPTQYAPPLVQACRTDADLPPSVFVYNKPGISRCEGGDAPSVSSAKESALHHRSFDLKRLTSLEEAVRSYADGRQRRTAPPSPGFSKRGHGMMIKDSTHICQHDAAAHLAINYNKPTDDQDHSSSRFVKVACSKEALLKRSLSQPGGGSSKGWMRRTRLHAGVDHHVYDMESSATMLKHNSAGHVAGGPAHLVGVQWNAEQPQDGAKLSCFPISLIGSSPGRQKHGRSSTLDEISDIVGKHNSNTVDIHNQDKFMSSTNKPTLYIHQQQNKLPPPATWADFNIDVPVGASARGSCLATTMPPQHMGRYCRRSFSDISSLSSNDHHASAVLSKFKLWGLNHKIKALCRKFCSSCPKFSPNSASSMSTDFN